MFQSIKEVLWRPTSGRRTYAGLRRSLDTVGAVLGPLLAVGLMLLWSTDFRAVFWLAWICTSSGGKTYESNLSRKLYRLGASYWWVVCIGATLMLARFSEAFLVLRA